MDKISDLAKPRYIVAGSAILFGTILAYISSKSPSRQARKRGAKLPPGPERAYLIGNLKNFPKTRWYEHFCQWQKEYGDIIYVNIAGTSIVVLNSIEAADELLNRRTNLYSSRPYKAMTNDVMGAGWTLVAAQPGPHFNEQRKVFRKAIGASAVSGYDHFINYQIEPLLRDLAKVDGDPLPVVMSALGALIIKVGYGERVFEEHGQEMIRWNRIRSEMITRVFQQFWLVDVFPFLKHIPVWFPGATFRRIGEEGIHLARLIRYHAYNLVAQSAANGTADESVVSRHLNDSDSTRNDLRDAVAVMYATGADTTSTSIVNFFYSLLIHPDIQKRVHREMDAVLGSGHSPALSEIRQLEYFNAVWKESLRWNVVAALGLPHVNSKEDVWNGYYIPKGTIVMPNIGFMLKDPRIWGEDSHLFRPERFLAAYNPHLDKLPDMTSLPFGFGRRICPGRFLAERAGLQFAAAVVSAFDIVPIEGDSIDRKVIFDDSVVRRPSNLRCKFLPRH